MFLYNCRLWVHRACDYKRVICCHPKNSNQWMFPCSFIGCVFVDVDSVSLIWCFCKEKRSRTGDWLQFHYSQGHWFQRVWDSWNWDKEPWTKPWQHLKRLSEKINCIEMEKVWAPGNAANIHPDGARWNWLTEKRRKRQTQCGRQRRSVTRRSDRGLPAAPGSLSCQESE